MNKLKKINLEITENLNNTDVALNQTISGNILKIQFLHYIQTLKQFFVFLLNFMHFLVNLLFSMITVSL